MDNTEKKEVVILNAKLRKFLEMETGIGIAVESNEFNVSHKRCQTEGMKSTAVLKFPETKEQVVQTQMRSLPAP